jgi:hypothetical protein
MPARLRRGTRRGGERPISVTHTDGKRPPQPSRQKAFVIHPRNAAISAIATHCHAADSAPHLRHKLCELLGLRHASAASTLPAAGLTSGQFGYDWGEGVGDVGAEDEVGEADLLASSLDFFGGRRRVTGKYGQ